VGRVARNVCSRLHRFPGRPDPRGRSRRVSEGVASETAPMAQPMEPSLLPPPPYRTYPRSSR
jgi:hypothetical protein